MIFDRKEQKLLLDGRKYTSNDISKLIVGGGKAFSPAVWELLLFLNKWFDDSTTIVVHTSGSTGTPKELLVRKDQMMQSARLTCEYLNLQPGDTALLCMNLCYIGAMMVVVRSLVAGLNLIVRPASGHPLADVKEPLKFAAMVPLQVYNTLQVTEERQQLEQIDILIIGGGAVDNTLANEIKNLPGAVYSTYGMTETLSHIALRRLNGAFASEHYYPFNSVKLSLSSENTLVIEAPLVCDNILQTNDIAYIHLDGSFTILGRKDNVINSGGIKIQAEQVEKKLHSLFSGSFVITCVPDSRLGQAVTLLTEVQLNITELKDKIKTILPPYYCPKYIYIVKQIPQTENGKINRIGCRNLAQKLLLSQNI
ncbi:AMP-binding protein [Bacteroides sp.]|uniref:AMP-binding protein n=1 Tax=Bacteroides sp. TaxID=29523 RepID=UPI0026222F67|nr:AMP-binding protein [Bacteroides sp.]MDD3037453.1 AMP-binding protein [Bacteroides sp.]